MSELPDDADRDGAPNGGDSGVPEEPDEGVTDFAALFAAAEKRAAAARQRQRRRNGDGYDDRVDPASGWLDAADFDGSRDPEDLEERDRRLRPAYSRQVCVRLTPSQYDELERAADLYGLAIGTMARMLVRRGARAVLDSYRRYDLQVGETDG
jgi:hypothetical protein